MHYDELITIGAVIMEAEATLGNIGWTLPLVVAHAVNMACAKILAASVFIASAVVSNRFNTVTLTAHVERKIDDSNYVTIVIIRLVSALVSARVSKHNVRGRGKNSIKICGVTGIDIVRDVSAVYGYARGNVLEYECASGSRAYVTLNVCDIHVVVHFIVLYAIRHSAGGFIRYGNRNLYPMAVIGALKSDARPGVSSYSLEVIPFTAVIKIVIIATDHAIGALAIKLGTTIANVISVRIAVTEGRSHRIVAFIVSAVFYSVNVSASHTVVGAIHTTVYAIRLISLIVHNITSAARTVTGYIPLLLTNAAVEAVSAIYTHTLCYAVARITVIITILTSEALNESVARHRMLLYEYK